MTFDELVAGAQARAAADVAVGIADLRRAIDTAPEWATEETWDGRTTHVVPKRAILLGHLRRIEAVRS